MSFVQVRIEEELKEEVIKLFNELGLDLSTAIRLFLKKSVEDKKLPFKLKVKEHDNFKDVKYRIKADVLVPPSTNPFELMDEFARVCKENGWHCLGGGVQYPNKVLTLSKKDEGIYYYGSPYKIEKLAENYDFTPFKELAIAFGSKPSHISINEGKVIHDGITYPVYLYQIDEKIEIGKDFINHPNSTFEVGMEFRTKREIKLKLIDVINE